MAGLGYDGSICIDTHINSSGFSKGLTKMAADLEKQVKKSETLLEGLQKKAGRIVRNIHNKRLRTGRRKGKAGRPQKES